MLSNAMQTFVISMIVVVPMLLAVRSGLHRDDVYQAGLRA